MTDNIEKIKTYIGFAIKSKKMRGGANGITLLKTVDLLILCHTAGSNCKKDADKLQRKFNCPIVLSKTVKIEDIVFKENCKIIALWDKNLVKAILENLDDNFVLYQGGEING